MKAYKETVRKCYKYKDWQQPTLTSNGTMGGNSFACDQSSVLDSGDAVYPCFNGTNRWHSAKGLPDWVSFYNPNALIVTSLTITNGDQSIWKAIKDGTIQGSNDGVGWVDIKAFSNSNTTASSTWNINLSDNTNAYKYYRIYITSSHYNNGGYYCVIGKIDITAKEVVYGASSDYDFYEDIDVYSLPAKQVPIYEKYDYEYLNTLPTYASATEGEAGINGISFSPSAMYFCVARTLQSTVTNSYDYKVVWYFGGREFKLDTCTYQGYVVNLRTPYASLTQIEGSNDNKTWEVVTAPVNNYYKYYRFTFVGSETNRYAGMGMQYFNLTGNLRKKVVSTKGEPVDTITQYLGITY